MRNIKIEIHTENAAFEDYPNELPRILINLALKLQEGGRPETLLDTNGNKVGTVSYEE